MEKLTLRSRMPFGKYKGTPIGEIPPAYLLGLLNERIPQNLEKLLKEHREEFEDQVEL